MTKSKFYAFAEVVPYAIIPLIWIGMSFGFKNVSLETDIAKAVLVTLAKDVMSAVVYLLIVIVKGKLRETVKLLKESTGWLVIAAGIFGGPIGYTLYNSAFFYAGPSYGHIFTSFEPIILVISGILIFKRKYNAKLWLGVIITVLALSGTVFGSSFDGGDKGWRNFIGALLGLFGAAAWAIETMLFDKAFNKMDKNDKEATTKLLSLKMTSAMIFGFGIMMPMTSHLATHDAGFSFRALGSIFTTNSYLWRFLLAGSLIIIARYMFFYAINREGGTLVAVVYNFTVIVTPIFMLLWFAITSDWLTGDGHGKTTNEWISIGVTTPFIILGVTLVTLNKPKIIRA